MPENKQYEYYDSSKRIENIRRRLAILEDMHSEASLNAITGFVPGFDPNGVSMNPASSTADQKQAYKDQADEIWATIEELRAQRDAIANQ